MRVYQFAKKIGATSARVMKWAAECEIEVYSPLSELEDADVHALNALFLKEGPASVKAEAEAVRSRRKAKAEKAVKARVAKDKAQAEALEAARQRAIAVHNGQPFVITPAAAPAVQPGEEESPSAEPPENKQPEAEEKGPKVEIGVSLPELPKVSFEMSEEQDAPGGDDFEDEDDEDALDYLQGKDRGRSSKKDVKKERKLFKKIIKAGRLTEMPERLR